MGCTGGLPRLAAVRPNRLHFAVSFRRRSILDTNGSTNRKAFLSSLGLVSLAGCAAGAGGLSSVPILGGGARSDSKNLIQRMALGGPPYSVVATSTGGKILDSSGSMAFQMDVNPVTQLMTFTCPGGQKYYSTAQTTMYLDTPVNLGNGISLTATSGTTSTLSASVSHPAMGVTGTVSGVQSASSKGGIPGTLTTVNYQDSQYGSLQGQGWVKGGPAGGGGGCKNQCPQDAGCVINTVIEWLQCASTCNRAFQIAKAAALVGAEIPGTDLIELGILGATAMALGAAAWWYCNHQQPQ